MISESASLTWFSAGPVTCYSQRSGSVPSLTPKALSFVPSASEPPLPGGTTLPSRLTRQVSPDRDGQIVVFLLLSSLQVIPAHRLLGSSATSAPACRGFYFLSSFIQGFWHSEGNKNQLLLAAAFSTVRKGPNLQAPTKR